MSIAKSIEDRAKINIQEALVQTFGAFRGLLISDLFQECNSALNEMDTTSLDRRILIVALMATAPATESELPSRPDFFNAVKKRLTTEIGQERADELLSGLS